MGQVVHLSSRRHGRRAAAAAFTRREVVTTPFARAEARPGDYLRSLPADSLTLAQVRELALITAADVAGDPEVAAALLRKANAIALGMTPAEDLPPLEPTIKNARPPRSPRLVPCADDRYKPRRPALMLWQWIVLLLAVALAIHVTRF